jgi:hypothetical protein
MDFETLPALLHRPLWQYYISVALVMLPTLRILARAGFKPWSALLLFVPHVGYVFCAAYMALNRWPGMKKPAVLADGGKP